MVVIEIDVISDIVCVWCFIAKRKLDNAIALYQKTYPGGRDDVFAIKWRPYYLNYNPPAQSVDKADVAKVKLAGVSPEKLTAMTTRVNQIGESVGIHFKNGGKIGSTRDAHRLTHLSQSKSPEVQDALVEGIFQAYHEQERDISDPQVLRDIAISAGLDQPEVDELLSTDIYGDIVDIEAQQNRAVVKAGVPHFIIQGENRIDGAQDVMEYMEMFIKIREEKLSKA